MYIFFFTDIVTERTMLDTHATAYLRLTPFARRDTPFDYGTGASVSVHMGSACGKSGAPQANIVAEGDGATRPSADASRIPGILHLLNAASGKPVSKDIFQAFISKHPNGPGAYWGNPKRFGEPFDSTTFFMAYSKDATAGPTAKRVLMSIVENSDAAGASWAKEGVNIAADDWSEEFQDDASQFFGETYAAMFGMGMIDSHETLMQYWSSTGALDKTIGRYLRFFRTIKVLALY